MRPIALHACRITYADPDTRSEVTIEAALPTYWPETTHSSQTLPSQPAWVSHC
jgi:hypothetical protein